MAYRDIEDPDFFETGKAILVMCLTIGMFGGFTELFLALPKVYKLPFAFAVGAVFLAPTLAWLWRKLIDVLPQWIKTSEGNALTPTWGRWASLGFAVFWLWAAWHTIYPSGIPE
ncbi:MAG: hypothetical protein K2W95_20905 [Candidatus Obscuribacterales bacterium]|nr:hypothetical protein [Candidatus Obscuribacterales bacterium]